MKKDVNKVKKIKKNKYAGTKINPSRFHVSQLKFYAFLLPLAAFMALPIVFVLSNAFKPMDELFTYPPTFFVRNPTMLNFNKLIRTAGDTNIPASRYIFNTLSITVLTIVITLLLSVMAGYALSKKNFKIKKVLFEINTLALMFVPIAVAVPRYLIMVNLKLVDTFIANVIPLVVTPVGVFLIKQFVDTIPDALLEAARMDGANDIYILRSIIVPLAMPALATVAILSFQSSWGSLEASQLYINNEALKSFAYYLRTFIASVDTMRDGGIRVATAGMAAASALIMFVPNLIIFVFMQSRVMNTMAHSGIK